MASQVVVAHPGRQYAYDVVLGAQRAGLLQAFATGVYFSSRSRTHRVLRKLSSAPVPLARMFGGAANRSSPEVDASRVVTFPSYAYAARALRRTPVGLSAERWADHRCDCAIARWLTRLDPPPRIVHGFEGGAEATFKAAKAVGAQVLLDASCAHEYAVAAVLSEGSDPGESAVTARVRAEREFADYVLAPSASVAECLLANNVPSGKIVRVPFGVDAVRFAPRERRGEGFRVLYVGNVGLRKGVRYLLEAWRRLALPGGELILVGGADVHGRRILREYRGIFRWSDQVPRVAVHRWFSEADVFVFPSLAEGSALVTYEAMAAGLPIITTAESGSVIRDGQEGFIVPARSPDALADRIRLLYDQPRVRIEMGVRARRRIEQHYTLDHYHSRLRQVYEAILSGVDPRTAVDESL